MSLGSLELKPETASYKPIDDAGLEQIGRILAQTQLAKNPLATHLYGVNQIGEFFRITIEQVTAAVQVCSATIRGGKENLRCISIINGEMKIDPEHGLVDIRDNYGNDLLLSSHDPAVILHGQNK